MNKETENLRAVGRVNKVVSKHGLGSPELRMFNIKVSAIKDDDCEAHIREIKILASQYREIDDKEYDSLANDVLLIAAMLEITYRQG